jgi:hypothetical protein
LPSQGIFLSYRREDAAPYARLLQRDMRERFPDARVFLDLDSIEAGVPFARVIQEALDSCAVLVALIGRQWVALADAEGSRRLDNPGDLVRLEVQTALERGVRVIPVLVDGARPPRQEQLPSELHKLAGLNALELSYARYDYDAGRLLDLIESVLKAKAELGCEALEKQAEEAGKAGDRAAARDLYAAVVPIREWVSGAEHPKTLRARANLAHWTGKAGDAAAARDQFAELLPVMKRVLGPEHPDTKRAADELAAWDLYAQRGL